MQFLSFIPRYFARRKAVADLREQCDEARRGNSETAKLLLELKGMREDSRAHAKEVFARMEWFRAQLKSWDGNGLPATREEFEALCPSAATRENAVCAQEGAEFYWDGKSLWPGANGGLAAHAESQRALDLTDAPVFDADHDLQIMGILGVNAKAAWVLVADLPVQLTEHAHIKSRRLRFASIIEFKPNDQGSGSFHCYGRLPDSQ